MSINKSINSFCNYVEKKYENSFFKEYNTVFFKISLYGGLTAGASMKVFSKISFLRATIIGTTNLLALTILAYSILESYELSKKNPSDKTLPNSIAFLVLLVPFFGIPYAGGVSISQGISIFALSLLGFPIKSIFS